MMKKQTVSLFAILLAISAAFTACNNKTSTDRGALEFDSIPLNVTEHLFGDTAKPACNLVISLAYASRSDDDALKDSLNARLLSACLGDGYARTTPQEAVQRYREQYVKDYRNDLEELYRKEEKEFGDADQRAWYSYYKYIRGEAQFVPAFLGEVPALFRDGTRPVDVALLNVSRPNAEGYCSYGVSADLAVLETLMKNQGL